MVYRSPTMIAVNDLSFSYKGGQQNAISGLTFEIDRGEVFGFLGPSGAGKSTTQKVLIRLLRLYQGTVSVLNRSLEDWGPDYFEQIGVSFEFPTHFSKLTGIENLTYFSRLYPRPTHSPTLALSKALGVLFVPLLVAYFVKPPWQLLFGLDPLYWPVKVFWLVEANAAIAWVYLAIAIIVQIFVLSLLLRRMNRRGAA